MCQLCHATWLCVCACVRALMQGQRSEHWTPHYARQSGSPCRSHVLTAASLPPGPAHVGAPPSGEEKQSHLLGALHSVLEQDPVPCSSWATPHPYSLYCPRQGLLAVRLQCAPRCPPADPPKTSYRASPTSYRDWEAFVSKGGSSQKTKGLRCQEVRISIHMYTALAAFKQPKNKWTCLIRSLRIQVRSELRGTQLRQTVREWLGRAWGCWQHLAQRVSHTCAMKPPMLDPAG